MNYPYPAALVFAAPIGLLAIYCFARWPLFDRLCDRLVRLGDALYCIFWWTAFRVYVIYLNWRADRMEARRAKERDAWTDADLDQVLRRYMPAASIGMPRHSVPGEIWMESRGTWEDTQ
jgi:hypothetical protein